MGKGGGGEGSKMSFFPCKRDWGSNPTRMPPEYMARGIGH